MAEHFSYWKLLEGQKPPETPGQNVVLTLKITLDAYPTRTDLNNITDHICTYLHKQCLTMPQPIRTHINTKEVLE